jgi:NAD+ diphosphatase
MAYPEAIDLPFNFEVIRSNFTFAHPGEEEPSDAGYWIVLQAGGMAVREEGASRALHFGDSPVAEPWPLRMGTWRGSSLRVVTLPKGEPLPAGFVWEAFNAPVQQLPDDVMTLGGLASQILAWRRKSARCSVCGAATAEIAETWGRRCGGCGMEHYPHIHPCVIVLVRKGEEFLLGRKAEWADGRYSLVAGFVDFGESLEECVRREVREETGVEVTNIRYVGSQNWPFPSQLMAGFVADWAGGEIDVSSDELEDAQWFCRERLPPAFPAKRSIARWIIDNYALGDR